MLGEADEVSERAKIAEADTWSKDGLELDGGGMVYLLVREVTRRLRGGKKTSRGPRPERGIEGKTYRRHQVSDILRTTAPLRLAEKRGVEKGRRLKDW